MIELIIGDNSIVITLGSNGLLTTEDVDQASKVIQNSSVLLCQFETPLNTTLHALQLHKDRGQYTNLLFK